MSENQEILQKKNCKRQASRLLGVASLWSLEHLGGNTCLCLCVHVFHWKICTLTEVGSTLICQEHESALKFSLSKIKNILMKSKHGFQMVVTFLRLTLSFDFLSVTAAACYCSFSLVLLHYLYKMLFVYESIFMIGDGWC